MFRATVYETFRLASREFKKKILQRDYPVVQDVHILIALFLLLGHLSVDVTYVC
jgi:ABC-type dipeptide/oligopeptide/nickel transport system permease component